ncbi:MAG: hypothetical protein ACRDUS_16315 [Mycobacterium sp.]
MTWFVDWPTPPPLAHNGWEFATWVLIAIVALVLGAAWIMHHGARKDVRAVLHQVKNSHSTNLRDDVDGVGGQLDDALGKLESLARDVRGVRQDVSGLRGEIGGLRGEVRTERAERQEADAQLRDDHGRRRDS